MSSKVNKRIVNFSWLRYPAKTPQSNRFPRSPVPRCHAGKSPERGRWREFAATALAGGRLAREDGCRILLPAFPQEFHHANQLPPLQLRVEPAGADNHAPKVLAVWSNVSDVGAGRPNIQSNKIKPRCRRGTKTFATRRCFAHQRRASRRWAFDLPKMSPD